MFFSFYLCIKRFTLILKKQMPFECPGICFLSVLISVSYINFLTDFLSIIVHGSAI